MNTAHLSSLLVLGKLISLTDACPECFLPNVVPLLFGILFFFFFNRAPLPGLQVEREVYAVW